MGIGHCRALTQQGDVKIGLNSDKLDSIIHQMREEFGVNNYEVRGDKGDYTPNEQEKFLMEDMLEGFIYELKKINHGQPEGLV